MLLLVYLQAQLWGQTRSGSSRDIVIDKNTVLCVAADQSEPVLRAVDDLASDMSKVFGRRPQVVHRLADAHATVLAIGKLLEAEAVPVNVALSSTPESFTIDAEPAKSGRGHAIAMVRLNGADMRGTMYAIYEFSQKFLGVDPMYFWTDHEPAPRDTVSVPAQFHTSGAPVFGYRGFFINDEDLLTGWTPGEGKDGTGIRLDTWNRIYETLLRLKANMVVPGTWTFPDEPQYRLASERGLIVGQHHAMPLGLNVARWPQDVPYNFTTHPEVLEHAWRNAVAAVPSSRETLWSVGLRGLSDVSYAAMDPSVRNNDKALGALISKAVAEQMATVRAKFPKARFVTDLWQEGTRLMQEGYLKIPPEVTTVWADTGYGLMQDKGEVRAGEGAYFHVAMMNNEANQLTEMVPVQRIASEMSRYESAKATSFFLVNTSDIRPVVMTARATMDFAWSGAAEASSGSYYRDWTREEFGDRASPAVEAVLKEYFAAPAHQGVKGHQGEAAREYGDQMYQVEARQMMLNAMLDYPLSYVPDQAPKWETPRHVAGVGLAHALDIAQRERAACEEAQPRWDAVWRHAKAAETDVLPDRRDFYQASILTMIAINRESNRMLLELAKAVEDSHTKKIKAANDEIAQAAAALDRIAVQEDKAEYGKWKGWYHGDWLTGIPQTRNMLNTFAAYVADPTAPIPPPIIWNDWEAYYHIMHYEGDRSVDIR